MRTCEVLVLNFRLSSQENFRVFDFATGFDSRLATGCAMNPRLAFPRICCHCSLWCVHPGGLAQMAERPLCMRQARGSMPLSSTHHNNHGDECVACRVRMFVGRSGDVAQMVERVLSMHEAMGSMPIFSTPFLFTRKHLSGLSLGSIPSVRRLWSPAPLAQSAERRSHNPKPGNTLSVVLQQS